MKYVVQGVRFTRLGLRVGFRIEGTAGWIRFAEVLVSWDYFDDSDAWALYSADVRRRAEDDGDVWPDPPLPLDWS